jgi:hypothetical protein
LRRKREKGGRLEKFRFAKVDGRNIIDTKNRRHHGAFGTLVLIDIQKQPEVNKKETGLASGLFVLSC